MKKGILLFISLIISLHNIAQQKFPGGVPGYWVPNARLYTDVPSPVASSLGRYGDVPISYFTGNPKISIPFYNLSVRGVSMPITLNYESNGVLPNSLPSWTGQNWTLDVGGVINRTVNGLYDEWEYPKQSMMGQEVFNYFKSHGKLRELLGYAEGNYKKLKDVLINNNYDLSPDEFTFHFMGKSGKFFLKDDGSWKVLSNDNLEIIFDYNDKSNFTSPLFSKYPKSTALQRDVPKTIAGFIIRDDQGNVYHFGYNRNAIEYSTNFWHMSKIEDEECWHAMSWYLSKVTDKYGNVLYQLDYRRGPYVIQAFNSYYSDYVKEKATGILGPMNEYSTTNSQFPYTISISSPVYLTKVHSMDGNCVSIASGNSNDDMATEKMYKSLYKGTAATSTFYTKMSSMVPGWGINNPETGAFYYLEEDKDSLSKFKYTPQNKDKLDILRYSRIQKLSSITIHNEKGSDDYIGYILHISTSGSRLRLDSIIVQDKNMFHSKREGIVGVYRFKYNEFDRLPEDYLTTAVDHWGYFNGKPYMDSHGQPKENLLEVRKPDFNYTKVGSLSEIIYPTGGVCTIEYEPNDYSKKLSTDRQSIEYEAGIGGGLRVKSIKVYDSPSKEKLLRQTKLAYSDPKTGRTSGELFATPLYYWPNWTLKCEQKNATYHLSTNHTSSIVPLANSFGAPIGYSVVTEDIIDQYGKITERHVYRYSNLSDPTVRDEPFYLTFGYKGSTTPFDEFSEKGFKRGKLLQEEIYDGDGRKARTIAYKYRSDENTYLSRYVFSSNLKYECYGNSAQYGHYTGGVFKLYYPKYDIVEEQDTIFHTDGSLPLVTIHSYEKEDRRFLSWRPYRHEIDLRLVNSEGLKRGRFKELRRYEYGKFDSKSGMDSILYKGMFQIVPFSMFYERNNLPVISYTTEYRQLKINDRLCAVPDKVKCKYRADKEETLLSFTGYTNTGMPSSIKEIGKPQKFFKWGFNENKLIMESNGYIPIDVKEENYYRTSEVMKKMSQYIWTSSGTSTKGYIYNPLFGATTVILPDSNIATYEYDNIGRLIGIYDSDHNKSMKFDYHYRK